jgi:hypothetical protein
MALKQLATNLSPWRPGFDSSLVHMEHVVDKASEGQVFLTVLQFSFISVILPMLPH